MADDNGTDGGRWEDPSSGTGEVGVGPVESDRSTMAAEAAGAGVTRTAFRSVIAVAAGAAAVGALAVGALAIGRLRVGDAAVRRLRIGQLEVEELRVRRLHVVESD
jgi:hypothetical protein